MLFLAALFFLLRGRIVYFDTGPRFYSTQNFVTAGDDLITLLQALGDLDIRRAADAGFHWHKLGLLVADRKYALDLIFLLRRIRWSGCRLHRAALVRVLLLKIRAATDGESLDRNAEHAITSGGSDLGRGRKPRPQPFRRVFQSDHDLEILRLLAGRRGLRSRNARGAHDCIIADLGHRPVKYLARNRVNRHFR